MEPIKQFNRESVLPHLELLNEAVRKHPEDPICQAEKAKLYGHCIANLLFDDRSVALEQLHEAGQAALRLSPQNATCLAKYGHACSLGGEWDEALELLHRADELVPGLPAAQLGLGHALIMSGGDYERGVEACRKFIRCDPLNPYVVLAWYYLGVGLQRMKRFSEAMDAYQTAIRRDYSGIWVYLMMAECLVRLNRQEEAKPYVMQARRIQPDLTFDRIAEGWGKNIPRASFRRILRLLLSDEAKVML